MRDEALRWRRSPPRRSLAPAAAAAARRRRPTLRPARLRRHLRRRRSGDRPDPGRRPPLRDAAPTSKSTPTRARSRATDPRRRRHQGPDRRPGPGPGRRPHRGAALLDADFLDDSSAKRAARASRRSAPPTCMLGTAKRRSGRNHRPPAVYNLTPPPGALVRIGFLVSPCRSRSTSASATSPPYNVHRPPGQHPPVADLLRPRP